MVALCTAKKLQLIALANLKLGIIEIVNLDVCGRLLITNPVSESDLLEQTPQCTL